MPVKVGDLRRNDMIRRVPSIQSRQEVDKKSGLTSMDHLIRRPRKASREQRSDSPSVRRVNSTIRVASVMACLGLLLTTITFATSMQYFAQILDLRGVS